jgi:flagellar motor switch protein FliM
LVAADGVNSTQRDAMPGGTLSSSAHVSSGQVVSGQGVFGQDGLQRLEPGQLEVLGRLHEHFARRWAHQLSADIQHPLEVTFKSLETSTYAELALANSPPCCFATLTAVPLATRVIWKVDPSILYPLFDWLLGGGSEPSPIPVRPMTEIEMLLAERIVTTWCDQYAEVWQHVLSLELRVERFEHNPLRSRPLPPLAPLMLVTWEIRLAGSRGDVTWGIPWTAMLPLTHKLTSGTGYAGSSGPHSTDGSSSTAESHSIDSRSGIRPVRFDGAQLAPESHLRWPSDNDAA